MVQFFDKNHINPLGIYGQTRTTNEYMNFSTWNTIIFGIIWIVNVSVDYFRLNYSQGGLTRRGRVCINGGQGGLDVTHFPPILATNYSHLLPAAEGSQFCPELLLLHSELKLFFYYRWNQVLLIDIFMSRVASKKGTVIFF